VQSYEEKAGPRRRGLRQVCDITEEAFRIVLTMETESRTAKKKK
jgi:hypothetical protein